MQGAGSLESQQRVTEQAALKSNLMDLAIYLAADLGFKR